MDRSHFGEVAAVSRYWTPAHLDVTDVPIVYARPKPTWIDRIDRRTVDAGDRLARRRMNSLAVVHPCEIPVLPPLPKRAEPAPPERHAQLERLWVSLYGAVARRLPSRRIAV